MTDTDSQNPAAGVAPKGEAPVVFWDGYGLDHAESGVSVHARSLAAAWQESWRPRVVVPRGTMAAGPIGAFELIETTGRLKPVWPERVGRIVDEAVGKARGGVILHGLSNFNLPGLTARPPVHTVLTVHDLIPLLRPDAVSKALALQMRFLLPRAIRRADRIVCVSRWTLDTIAARFPEARGKCVVIPNGRLAVAAAKPQEPRETSTIHALSVGRSEPYKRLPFLVELLRRSKLPLTLTLVTDPTGAARLRQEAADLVSAGRLQLLSRVPTAELHRLYAEADVYLQPSEVEGYCLPAADALAALTPVVYRKGSGIDEVAGTTAAWGLAPAADVKAWEEATEAAAAAGKAAAFRQTVQAHLGTLPTWSAVATRVAALYRELVN